MTETMYAAGGIGLVATQVDVHHRVVTIDVSPAERPASYLEGPLRAIIGPLLFYAAGS